MKPNWPGVPESLSIWPQFHAYYCSVTDKLFLFQERMKCEAVTGKQNKTITHTQTKQTKTTNKQKKTKAPHFFMLVLGGVHLVPGYFAKC